MSGCCCIQFIFSSPETPIVSLIQHSLICPPVDPCMYVDGPIAIYNLPCRAVHAHARRPPQSHHTRSPIHFKDRRDESAWRGVFSLSFICPISNQLTNSFVDNLALIASYSNNDHLNHLSCHCRWQMVKKVRTSVTYCLMWLHFAQLIA